MVFSFEMPHWLVSFLFGFLPLVCTLSMTCVHCTYHEIDKRDPRLGVKLTPFSAGMLLLATLLYQALLTQSGYWLGASFLLPQLLLACMYLAEAQQPLPKQQHDETANGSPLDYDAP